MSPASCAYCGKVARWSQASYWQMHDGCMDLAATDTTLEGLFGGFSVEFYGFFRGVPLVEYNGRAYRLVTGRVSGAFFGKVASTWPA